MLLIEYGYPLAILSKGRILTIYNLYLSSPAIVELSLTNRPAETPKKTPPPKRCHAFPAHDDSWVGHCTAELFDVVP